MIEVGCCKLEPWWETACCILISDWPQPASSRARCLPAAAAWLRRWPAKQHVWQADWLAGQLTVNTGMREYWPAVLLVRSSKHLDFTALSTVAGLGKWRTACVSSATLNLFSVPHVDIMGCDVFCACKQISIKKNIERIHKLPSVLHKHVQRMWQL